MKLTLKLVIALAILTAAATAYAAVPDVSKWSCPDVPASISQNAYGVEVNFCDNDNNIYVKVSGELIYIHEHRMDAGKASYYNALKTGDWWVEVVNKSDVIWEEKRIGKKGEEDIEVSIGDDNGVVVAKRLIPFIKK